MISPVASLVSEETSHRCSDVSQRCLMGKGFSWRPRKVPTASLCLAGSPFLLESLHLVVLGMHTVFSR